MFNFTNLTYRGAAALALSITLHTAPGFAAETCVAAPTCAELGYTLTSTANCVGTPLKCPFDTTKYNCTEMSDVTSKIMPNYTTRYNLSNNITYTVGSGALSSYKCLWIMFYTGGSSKNPGTIHTEWYINENIVGATDSNVTDYIMGFYPIYTGDTFRLKGGTVDGNDYLYYFPCRKSN